MPELCYTATQIKAGKALIVGLFSITIFQALAIKGLEARLNRGRNRFNQLHNMTEYFLNIIDENNIELTEFDLIALTALNEDE